MSRRALRGMAWQHRRALDPLLGPLSGFRALHPDIDVSWDACALAGFEVTAVAELAERYDLTILDHPFVEDIAAGRCLLPPDPLADETTDRVFVGPAHSRRRVGSRRTRRSRSIPTAWCARRLRPDWA